MEPLAREEAIADLDKQIQEANQAKSAAMKAKFSPKEDAPEVQTGTITYVFRNN